jgi:type III secretory pathway component EscS
MDLLIQPLVAIQQNGFALNILINLVIGILIVMVVQNWRRNRLLRSIDRSLKTLPTVRQSTQESISKHRRVA